LVVVVLTARLVVRLPQVGVAVAANLDTKMGKEILTNLDVK